MHTGRRTLLFLGLFIIAFAAPVWGQDANSVAESMAVSKERPAVAAANNFAAATTGISVEEFMEQSRQAASERAVFGGGVWLYAFILLSVACWLCIVRRSFKAASSERSGPPHTNALLRKSSKSKHEA